MCRRPVTFGGGIAMEKGGRGESTCAVNTPSFIQWAYQRSSIRAGSNALSKSICGITLRSPEPRVRGQKKKALDCLARGPPGSGPAPRGLRAAFFEFLDPLADDGLSNPGDDLPGHLAHDAVRQTLHDLLGDEI